jgi:hypothetical protein
MSSENKIRDDILSYREMCDAEEIQTLQRGMNFRMRPSYSVILMSQRANAPYHDRVYDDGITTRCRLQFTNICACPRASL